MRTWVADFLFAAILFVLTVNKLHQGFYADVWGELLIVAWLTDLYSVIWVVEGSSRVEGQIKTCSVSLRIVHDEEKSLDSLTD